MRGVATVLFVGCVFALVIVWGQKQRATAAQAESLPKRFQIVSESTIGGSMRVVVIQDARTKHCQAVLVGDGRMLLGDVPCE